MNKSELNIWILDTIAEGGYSFKELYDYIIKEVEITDFIYAIENLFDNHMMEVYLSAPHSSIAIDLDDINQNNCIKHYREVVETESLIGSRHFWKITKHGQYYLDEYINISKRM